MMTLWLHFGCEQIVFKPDGSQFNLRKMHCSLLLRHRFQAAAAAAVPSPPPLLVSIAALAPAVCSSGGGGAAVKLSE